MSDWYCSHCDFKIFGSKSTCSKCGTRRPGPPPAARAGDARPPSAKRVGDWECCGETQFASRHACRRCGKEQPVDRLIASSAKPLAQPIRAGDWVCATCKDVQFAARVTCRSCNASKPATATTSEENTCIVCADNVRNAGLVHGDDMHSVTCLECAHKIVAASGTCPMCRRFVERVVKLYE